MTRNYIDFGIDLGTTNSAICRVDQGVAAIVKSDRYQKDTTPSCVSINKKKSLEVGDGAMGANEKASFDKLANPNAVVDDTFIEFKRSMGTDKAHRSEHMQRDFSSPELSAEVLKKLKSYVRDENIRSAVITVPAKFKKPQIDATQKAAELAGLEYCELLQEPIAASISYGIDSQDIDGRWLVFDFGGGTFDAAVLSAEERVMKVIDTEGDNFLGGKDLDMAIVDEILLARLETETSFRGVMSDANKKQALRKALKPAAEEAKIALASGQSAKIYREDLLGVGSDVDLDMELSLAEVEMAIKPVFQKAIDKTKKLLRRNRLDRGGLTQIVLVGGPTQMQTLRQMLMDQLGVKVQTNVDPMTAIARGAAINASTIKIPEELREHDLAKVQLKIESPDSTVEATEMVSAAIQRHLSGGALPADLFFEIENQNGSWASGRHPFSGDKVLLPEVPLSAGMNQFSVGIFDPSGARYPCEPSGFSILQGITVAKQTLTHGIGMAVVNSDNDRTQVVFLRGLSRNQTLPAVGRGRFKTMRDLNPGNNSEVINIDLYEGEEGDDKVASPCNCTLFASNTIKADDVGLFVPADSEVEITIRCDTSRGATGSAFFPHADQTIDFPLNTPQDTVPKAEEVKQSIRKKISELKEEKDPDSDEDPERDDLIRRLEQEENKVDLASDDNELLESQENVRGVMKDVDRYEAEHVWLDAKDKLDARLDSLRKVVQSVNNPEAMRLLQQIENQYQQIVAQENVKLAEKLGDDIISLSVDIEKENPEFYISMIYWCYVNFDETQWTDRKAARQALDLAAHIIEEEGGIENYHGSLEKVQQAFHNISQYRIYEDDAASGGDVSRLGTID